MNSLSKKLFFFSVLTFAFINNPFAQQIDKSPAVIINDAVENTEAGTVNNDLVITNTEMPNSLIAEYPRLMKRFSTLYPDPINAQWTEIDNMLFVSFINNGCKTRASFTKNGKLNYAITDCHLQQLPARLQHYIKTRYPGYNVFNAIEINAYNTIAHRVILEDANGFITIKSTNEGIEETGQLGK